MITEEEISPSYFKHFNAFFIIVLHTLTVDVNLLFWLNHHSQIQHHIIPNILNFCIFRLSPKEHFLEFVCHNQWIFLMYPEIHLVWNQQHHYWSHKYMIYLSNLILTHIKPIKNINFMNRRVFLHHITKLIV